MNLLVASHSCATAANQRLYGEIKSLTGWNITLAVPAGWKDEFGNRLNEHPWHELEGRVEKIPVWGNGSIILHVYRKNWRRFLREKNFNAIYVNHEPYALATAQICHANQSQDSPASFGFYSCQNIEKSYPFPFSHLEDFVYRHSAYAFPITSSVEAVLRRKGYSGKSEICPLPFDPSLCKPRGRVADLELIPRDPGELVIGFAGRLVESKGLRTLARALPLLRDLQWKLVMMGTGNFEEEFKSLLQAEGLLGRTHFPGYIPHEETPRYLSALDLLVLPSETQPNWKEQFGRVIIESLASGTPVVGSNSGEIPKLIESSNGGLVFPEKDARKFADALRTLMTNPELRQDCAVKGMAWAAVHASLKAVAGKMAAAIDGSIRTTA